MIIPVEVIKSLEKQLEGVAFGKISLEISVHDSECKYRVIKEISLVPGKQTSGAVHKVGK